MSRPPTDIADTATRTPPPSPISSELDLRSAVTAGPNDVSEQLFLRASAETLARIETLSRAAVDRGPPGESTSVQS